MPLTRIQKLERTLSDFFCLKRKFLVANIISRNLKLRYRKSVLGYFWTLLVPLLTAAVYYFVFNVLHRVGTADYALTVVLGVLTWTFFAQTVNEGMGSLNANFGLLTQINLPLHVFPFCSAVTHLSVYIFSLPALIIFGIIFRSPLTLNLLFFPLFILQLFIIAYSIGLILSVSFVYIRDLRQVMGQVLHLWLYVTPVIYRGSRLKGKLAVISYLNPVGKIFSGLQRIVLDGQPPHLEEILTPTAWALGLMTVAIMVKDRVSRLAVERI